jgi:hypothetical protein
MPEKKERTMVDVFFDLCAEDQWKVAEELELRGYPGIDLRNFQTFINKIDRDASEFHITRLSLTTDQKHTLSRLIQ